MKQGIINPIISKILENIEQKFRNSPNSTIWEQSKPINEQVEFGNVLVQAANYLCEKEFNVNDLRKNIIENYAIQDSYFDSLNELADFDGGSDQWSISYCNSSCCESWLKRKFFLGIINTGYFIFSQKLNGLGTFLVNFGHFGGTEIYGVKWSTFDLQSEIEITKAKQICQIMLSKDKFVLDKFLQNSFKDLGIGIGLPSNDSISLFELPSMFAQHVQDDAIQPTRDSFIFSQCERNTIQSSLHHCYKKYWEQVLFGGAEHPCEKNLTDLNWDNCCHIWTTILQHRLKPIMKVMRMASGRGQSHFNVSNLLKPFSDNSYLSRFSFNESNLYYPDYPEARDKTSFIPACKYSNDSQYFNDSCKLFEPVVTDLGICYAFNAESLMKMFKKSSFTEAFFEAFEYDLLEPQNNFANGAGDKFALKFMLDNSKFLRRKSKTYPFKILISSKTSYFDAVSLAKEVKPGFETIFDIQPIEVVADEKLNHIKEKDRKCKFDHEVASEKSMSNKYSRSFCQFECRVDNAREKCQCTPWNIPTPPPIANPAICDLYGNTCFHSEMDNSKTIRHCIDMCPPDCDDIRFSINKQEIAINVDEECQMWKQSGMILAKNLVDQYKFYQDFSFNNTDNLDDSLIERKKRICREIMANDIALVKVRLEGNTYMKTIKSKRFTFADKLAFFGKIYGVCNPSKWGAGISG